MGQTTFANARGIAHKGSGGMSTGISRCVQDTGGAKSQSDSDSVPEYRPIL